MRASSQKYARLLHELKLMIVGGELREGDYMPSENTLVRQFGVSRPTVRKAVAELADQGLLDTIPGKGSVVRGLERSELQVTVLNLYWYMPSHEYPLIRKIVSRFNDEHTHIQVRLVPFQSESTPSIYAGYRSGNGRDHKPDLMSITNRFMMELRSEPIHTILRPLDERDVNERVYRFLWKANVHDGRLYAAPITFSPVMLLYNKSMFEQEGIPYPDNGWKWGDLAASASRLTRRADDGTIQYGFAFSPSFFRWPLFFLQAGGRFVRNGETCPAGQEDNAGIRFILDLLYKHQSGPLLLRSVGLSEQLFQKGKAGMILSTFYLSEQQNRSDAFEWGAAKFPAGAVDKSLAISTSIGISAECSHVQEAQTFIRYVLSKPIQAYIKANGTTLPASPEVAESARYPHSAFRGSGYYSFKETLSDIEVVHALGLDFGQVNELTAAMEMVWCRTETFERVWRSFLQANES